MNYAIFISKYPVFNKIGEAQFNSFLGDALAEINFRKWGALQGRATEMLIGCLLSSCPTDAALVNASGTIKAIKIDGEYEVQYDTASSSTKNDGSSWFCSEYQRLLALLEQQQAASKPPLHFHATRELKYPTNTPRSSRTGTNPAPYRGLEGEGYRER